MPTFERGPLRIELVSHRRVRGEDFPTPDPGAISDWFQMLVFFNSEPLDLYPNATPHPHPNERNLLTIGWVGREEVAVRDEDGKQVGTKRGADFRSRFFRAVFRRIAKAVLADLRGVTIGALTRQQEANAPAQIKRFLSWTETDPVDLKARSIDEAVSEVAGKEPTEDTRIPSGTSANIDCNFDGQVANGTNSDSGTTLEVGNSGGFPRRDVFEFPLAALSGASAINDLDLQLNVTSVNGWDAGDQFAIRPYGSGGSGDPSSASGATRYTDAGSQSPYFSGANDNSGNDLSVTGNHEFDLGTTADADLLAAIAGGQWALSFTPGTGVGSGDISRVEAIENAGSDPVTLVVDYTAGGTSHAADAAFSGAGAFGAAPTVSYAVVAALSGAAAFAASAFVSRPLVAAFSGAATFSAAATVSRPLATVLSGAGSFAANATETYVANMAVSGAGSLAPNATENYVAQAAFSGVGSFVANGGLSLPVASALAGVGSFAGATRVDRPIAAALQGVGSFNAPANMSLSAAAVLPGIGSFVGVGKGTYAASAAFAGTGTIGADATLAGILEAVAVFAGVATVALGATANYKISAAFSGVGSFAGVPTATLRLVMALSGVGSFAGAAQNSLGASAAFNGVGSFAGNSAVSRPLQAAFNGVGSLSASSLLTLRAAAVLAGFALLTGTLLDSALVLLIKLRGLDVDIIKSRALDIQATKFSGADIVNPKFNGIEQ